MSELISVLMPCYNREKFLHRAILSILNQSYENLQLIIYDDGSTDKSTDIIRKFMQDDKRIKLISGKKNLGVGYARNLLLAHCNTKYACWQDSDDVSSPDRIELQSKELKDFDLVFGTWDHLGKDKKGTTKGFATLMFPVDKNIWFNPDMQWGGEDWDWIERMRKKYLREHEIPKVLYSIDFHDNRIGSWKRKLCKEWGGIYTEEDLKGLTYSQAIKKFEERANG